MARRIVLILILQLFSSVGCEMANFKPVSGLEKNRSWSLDTLTKVKDDMTGYMDSPLLGNKMVVSIVPQDKELVLTLPAPNLFQKWRRDIAELPGATLSAVVNSQHQSFLILRYPLYLLIKNFEKFGSKSVLPNGQKIPGVPGGKLYTVKVPLDKQHQVQIYFEKGIVALLLEVPYDPLLATTIPVKRKLQGFKSGDIIGYAYTLPKESSEFGGLLVSALAPQATLKVLEQK